MVTPEETATQTGAAVVEASQEVGESEETRLPDGEAQEDLTGIEQGGAEGTPAGTPEPEPVERTFSQAEFDAQVESFKKMESAKDTYTAGIQKQLDDANQQRAVEQGQQYEAGQRAADMRQVDNGEITPAEADSKQRQRAQQLTNSQDQRNRQIADANMNQQAKVIWAHTTAIKLGIDPQVLVDDPSLTTVEEMEAKGAMMAERVQLDKDRAEFDQRVAAVPGTETFDGGQVGATGAAGSFARVEQRYADGDASRKEYEAARDARGI